MIFSFMVGMVVGAMFVTHLVNKVEQEKVDECEKCVYKDIPHMCNICKRKAFDHFTTKDEYVKQLDKSL